MTSDSKNTENFKTDFPLYVTTKYRKASFQCGPGGLNLMAIFMLLKVTQEGLKGATEKSWEDTLALQKRTSLY